MPPEQSAARHHLSSNADCFLEPPENLPLFQIISFLTVHSSGLAVLYLGHST